MSLNILLIQDDPSDAKDVRDALTNSGDGPFFVEWIRTCSEGAERLNTGGKQDTSSIAAVLVDLFLPESRGIETFDRLFELEPQIPILVLCGSHDEDVAKLAVQHGAQDYLLKGRLDSYLLPKALRSMVERAANAEALFQEKERAQVTLNSIGDAVMSTDVWGDVTYLNVVAETLAGWSREEAAGHPVEEIFRIIDAVTREVVRSPMDLAIRENRTVGLTPNCLLIRRDGVEAAIEDSAAPIHDRRGQVTGAVMVFHDVSTARALSLRMSYLAQHDALTDLPNRILFNDRLSQAMALAQRHQLRLAVLYLDVDNFKSINDSLGHGTGDRLLQSVAERLLASVRSSDTVSRQGGDEFVILLSEVQHARDAAVAADKILLALSVPHGVDQHELTATVSIGIAIYPSDGTEVESLIKSADSAMYQSRAKGRDTYQFYDAQMNVRIHERQVLESDLRRAVAKREFVLHYQPIMDLRTSAIIGAEALIRWRHPERGLIAPADFIPVAEQCGVIVPIGRWVLREACRQARAWQDAGLQATRIAVNVSTVELRAKDFVASVRAVLLETGLDPRYLEFELTETFLMQDGAATTATLQSLKSMGIHLSLDDFGTGYSSLSYVKRFPIDTLKIDQSFVRDLATDPNDASIVTAVISMGKSLGMRVVAEGVETREQLAFLQGHECLEGQGYYFSHPVDAEGFMPLLDGQPGGKRPRLIGGPAGGPRPGALPPAVALLPDVP